MSDSSNVPDVNISSSKYSALKFSIYNLSAENVDLLVSVMRITCYWHKPDPKNKIVMGSPNEHWWFKKKIIEKYCDRFIQWRLIPFFLSLHNFPLESSQCLLLNNPALFDRSIFLKLFQKLRNLVQLDVAN